MPESSVTLGLIGLAVGLSPISWQILIVTLMAKSHPVTYTRIFYFIPFYIYLSGFKLGLFNNYINVSILYSFNYFNIYLNL